LAEKLEVNRTIVYRLLATLELHRLVRRGIGHRYHLGLGLIRLAGRTQPLLAEAAVPVLRMLAEESGATAYLTIADGADGLVLAVQEPAWSDMHVCYRVGLRRPLAQGAAGAAVLAAREVPFGTRPEPGSVREPEAPGVHGHAAAVVGVPGVEAAVGTVALQRGIAEHEAELIVAAAERLADALR
jgi:DNA-binding IclR family transcriptional regulator